LPDRLQQLAQTPKESQPGRDCLNPTSASSKGATGSGSNIADHNTLAARFGRCVAYKVHQHQHRPPIPLFPASDRHLTLVHALHNRHRARLTPWTTPRRMLDMRR
jgi:N-acetyl-gamma-glutamylphosphate reductase